MGLNYTYRPPVVSICQFTVAVSPWHFPGPIPSNSDVTMLKECIIFYPFNRGLVDIDLVTTVLRIPDQQREECRCAYPSLTRQFQ